MALCYAAAFLEHSVMGSGIVRTHNDGWVAAAAPAPAGRVKY